MEKVNWYYGDEEITSIDQLPEGTYGFVYVIIYEDDMYYVGKKDLFKKVTLPALKNGEQRPNSERICKIKGGKRAYFDVLLKESDWLTYKGSSELTKELVVKGKHILDISHSKRYLTYLEAKRLFQEDVLEDEQSYNQNILGSFFKGNLD